MYTRETPFCLRPALLVLVAGLLAGLVAGCPSQERDSLAKPELLRVPTWTGPSEATLELWRANSEREIPPEAEALLEHFRDSRRALGLYAHVPLPAEAGEQAGDIVNRYQEALADWIRSHGVPAFRHLGHALWPIFADTVTRASEAARGTDDFDAWIAANEGDPVRDAYLGVAGDYMRAAQRLGIRDGGGQLVGDAQTERLLFARWWAQQIPGQYPLHMLAEPPENADFLRFLALTQSNQDSSTRYAWWQEAQVLSPANDMPPSHVIRAAFLVEEGRLQAARNLMQQQSTESPGDRMAEAALRWLDQRIAAQESVGARDE